MDKRSSVLIPLLLLFLVSMLSVSASAHESASPTSGYPPLSVAFNATYLQNEKVISFKWDFGDGNVSIYQDFSNLNTTHIYTQVGTYRASAPVSFDCGNGITGSYAQIFSIVVYPTANFTATPTSGNAPLTVGFKDTSTGSPISWSWNFGDGTSSYDQNPVHTYSTAGEYTVILSVRYATGIEIKSSYIVVNNPTRLIALFSATPTSGNTPLTVEFKDTSTGSPTSCIWDFGDGSTSTEQNPTHIYSAAGTYAVNLTVNNEKGTDSKLATITALEPIAPVASFRGNVTSGYAPLTVQFTDLSAGATEWSWDFGDKTYSTEQNPVHTYSKDQKYTVTLRVNNSVGTDTVQKDKYISVSKIKL